MGSKPHYRTVTFADEKQMDQGTNEMHDQGYIVHSWEGGVEDWGNGPFRRYTVLFQLLPATPDKPRGLASR